MSRCFESSSEDSNATIAVVGGGPAGCAAAWAAAQGGARVAIYEASQPGRDKPCGDMFLPAAVDVLKRIGLDELALRACGGRQHHKVDILGMSGRRLWTLDYSKLPLWIIPRCKLDQALRDCLPRNSVTVHYGTRITELIAPPHGRAIILACGAASALARAWGLDGKPLRAPAITAYAKLREMRDNPAFEFSGAELSGYRWIFPTSNMERGNAGVFSTVRVSGSFLRDQGSKLISSELRIWRGGVGTLWSGLGEKWHCQTLGAILTCGDAAGLIDPLTGEGLTAALLSGASAGSAAAAFLAAKSDNAPLDDYSHWVRSYFSQAYARSPLRTAWSQLSGKAAGTVPNS